MGVDFVATILGVCASLIIWHWEVVHFYLREGPIKGTQEKMRWREMMMIRQSGFPLSWATCVEYVALLEAAKSWAMLSFCTFSHTSRFYTIIVYHGLAVRLQAAKN